MPVYSDLTPLPTPRLVINENRTPRCFVQNDGVRAVAVGYGRAGKAFGAIVSVREPCFFQVALPFSGPGCAVGMLADCSSGLWLCFGFPWDFWDLFESDGLLLFG